jgi:Domain of unknown function (DUF4288)
MKWYLSKIVFKICASEHPQFDEHLRLVEANSFEEALLKARIIGISEEDSFINDRMQPVKWEFVNVSDLIPLNELKDGVELYSQIHEPEESSSYIHYVHQKAAALQLNHSPIF